MNVGGGNLASASEAISVLNDAADILPTLILRGLEAGAVRDTWADISRASDLIGYAPTNPLRAGLAKEFAYLVSLNAVQA